MAEKENQTPQQGETVQDAGGVREQNAAAGAPGNGDGGVESPAGASGTAGDGAASPAGAPAADPMRDGAGNGPQAAVGDGAAGSTDGGNGTAAGAGEKTQDGGQEQKGAATAAAPGAVPVAAPVVWYRSAPFMASLFLLLAIALVLGLMLYQKKQAEDALTRQQEQELAALRDRNDAMQAYVYQLRALLNLDPCAVAGALEQLTPPAGIIVPAVPAAPATPRPAQPDPAAPKAQAAPAAPAAPAEPQAQPAPAAPADGGQAKAATPSATAALLEQGTVFILNATDKGVSMGTGFFITPSLIVTNRHVVKDSTKVYFINKRIGAVQSASVALVASEQNLDLAVLQTTKPCSVTPLRLSTGLVQRTAPVSAWGYPGAVTFDDPKFRRLLNGDLTAAPEVVFSDGTVNVTLEYKPPLVVHSATISHGNSGGPLVNAQGDVVGINTMIKPDNKSYRQSSIAIASTAIASFLQASGVPFTGAR